MDTFQRQMQEQKVIEHELRSLPKGAKVYKQQQNSQLFFRTSKDKAFEECKRTLDSLVQEYKDAETPLDKEQQEHEQG